MKEVDTQLPLDVEIEGLPLEPKKFEYEQKELSDNFPEWFEFLSEAFVSDVVRQGEEELWDTDRDRGIRPLSRDVISSDGILKGSKMPDGEQVQISSVE